jgi:uncharacterized protein
VNISNGGAIREASAAGHEGVVRVLLEAGADINLTDNNKETALKVASTLGMDVYMRPYEETALQMALYYGHMGISDILLAAGAHVDGRDLWYASCAGHEGILHTLINVEAGVDVNMKRYGETALEIASRRGHTKTVRMLLDAGADVNEGSWALYFASCGGHEEVVHALIEGGAAVNQKVVGEKALKGAWRRGHTKIVQMLLDAGAALSPRQR